MAIDRLFGGVQTRPLLPGNDQSSKSLGAGFGSSLEKLVTNVEASAAQANVAVGQMLDGTGDVHDAMIALQQSEMTFQFSVQVRNKLVQAYQEIMRMPV
jgi:flagellar hook-basal body complex protein FliE